MLDQIPAVPAGETYASPEMPGIVRHRPEFDGRAGEYFGIWFVNLILSILTLGIYSAWAKVRTERYFYGNTRIAGASFEYLAEPIAILKGRLIAYAVVIALGLSSKFAPLLYSLLILAVFSVMPILVVMGLRFRARYSAWRGVRFRFAERLGAGYGPFLGWPLLNAVTLTAVYPLVKRRQQEFVVEGHRFGRELFGFHGQAGRYYAVYGVGLLLLFGVMIGAGLALSGAFSWAGETAAAFEFLAGFYLALFPVLVYLHVRYVNLMWNNTSLGAHRFESTLRVRDMLWLYFSNTIVIVCTIGLAVPWAMVRLARYRADHFALLATGSLDEFVAEAEGAYHAAGAELSDALDFGADFGL